MSNPEDYNPYWESDPDYDPENELHQFADQISTRLNNQSIEPVDPTQVTEQDLLEAMGIPQQYQDIEIENIESYPSLSNLFDVIERFQAESKEIEEGEHRCPFNNGKSELKVSKHGNHLTIHIENPYQQVEVQEYTFMVSFNPEEQSYEAVVTEIMILDPVYPPNAESETRNNQLYLYADSEGQKAEIKIPSKVPENLTDRRVHPLARMGTQAISYAKLKYGHHQYSAK